MKQRFSELLKLRRNEMPVYVSLVVGSVILYVLTILLSQASFFLKNVLSTTLANVLWVVIFSIVSVLIGSFILSGMIAVAVKKSEQSAASKFLRGAAKHGLRNTVVIILLLLCVMALNGLLYLVAQVLPFTAAAHAAVLFIIWVAGLLGGIIFLSVASFYMVIFSAGIWTSIRESARIVKRNYIYMLSILIGFFIVLQIFEFLLSRGFNSIVVELISALMLFPYFILVLSRFTENYGKKNDLRT